MTLSLEHTGLSFNARELLQPFTVGEATPGCIALDIPAGISPLALRDSYIGKQFIHQNVTWYDKHPWASETIPTGVYHLRLPVPGNDGKTFYEQKSLLLDGEVVAPLVLVGLAMLCLKKAGLSDPLQGGWVRCREPATKPLHRVVLRWDDGRLNVYSLWDGYSSERANLAAARRLA